MRWCAVLAMLGCGGGSSGEGTETNADGGGPDLDGACGEVGTAAVQVLGALSVEGGGPAVGATVWLEERNWNNPTRVYAQGATGAAGDFDLTADIVTVADCWGTAVDYYIVGQTADAYGERGINLYLFNAVEGTADGVATLDIPIPLLPDASGGSGLP